MWTGVALLIFVTYLALLSVALYVVMLNYGPDEKDKVKLKATLLTILACGALLWPAVWYLSIGRIILQTSGFFVLFGAIWPQLMLTIDMLSLPHHEDIRPENLGIVGSVQDDANSLIGVAFAFAMMMLSTYASAKKEIYGSLMMVMFALIICIAFVVPQPITKKDDDSRMVGAITQRTIFAYAMGYLLTALCVVIGVGSRFIK